MGHENLNTTQVYLSVTDKSKREAIKSLEIQPEAKNIIEPI